MRPTIERLKTVTRPNLVTPVGAPGVVERDERVTVPLSPFEVLYRCQFCGHEEVRIKLETDSD